MNLLGYIRTCANEQQNRIEIQDTLLHQFCKLYSHHTLVDVIVDKNTSAIAPFKKRPGGNKILELLQAGKASGILMTEINRAFSVNIEGLVQEQWFKKHHFAIFTILDQIDTSHPDGWWSFACKMITPDYEQHKKYWKDRRKLVEMDKNTHALPYIPFGCVSLNKTSNTTTVSALYRDPIVWQIREIIIELHKQNMSLQQICDYLFREQIPAPDGRPIWHASTLSGFIESYDSLKCLPKLAPDYGYDSTLTVKNHST